MDIQEVALKGAELRAYLEPLLLWEADLSRIPTKYDTTLVILRQTFSTEKKVVGFAVLCYCPKGIWLNHEIFYPKIHWKIAWLETDPQYKKRGYGTQIITHIRNKLGDMNIPIGLYAREAGNSFNLALWYYRLGAIILWNEEYEKENFLCFMKPDQIPEYIDDDEIHHVDEIVEFEASHSLRRVCTKPSHFCPGAICGLILENTETECSCKEDY